MTRPFKGLKGPIFVVQKHQARNLHYDFRLEMNGTLVSWAVPKGPSIAPKDKRLAVRVDDHALSYGDFEGRIAPGNYGAGAVIVWDYGTWTKISGGLESGKLVFSLHGKKLRGGWVLLKLRGSSKNWLLIKERDSAARETDLLAEAPESAWSGRTLEQVSLDPDAAEISCEEAAAGPATSKGDGEGASL